MKRKNKTGLAQARIAYCVIFSFLLLGCSGNTTHSTYSANTSLDSAITTTNQTSDTTSEAKLRVLQKIYSQAIGDYIQLVNKEYRLSFDTLFFGKRVFEQPDDFPDIELPSVIEHTNIRLISPDQGMAKQREDKSSFYINLIAWVNADKAEFIFVTFSNGMAHQFDCVINYKVSTNKYDIERSRFKNYLFKAK